MPLRVGVIGTGSIGMQHIRTLNSLQNLEVFAIPVRRERVGELNVGGFKSCQSLEEAATMGAKLVVVATDTNRHVSDSKKALLLGCHVLVEKPLAATMSDAQTILSAAQQAPLSTVLVGCVLRFSESLNIFKTWLPRLGKIHTVRIECQSYLPDWRPERPYRDSYSARLNEGGVLRDLIHEIDYAGWLFGWPGAIQAKIRNLGRLQITAEETADLLWETQSQTIVSINLDYLSCPSMRRMQANGENGVLEWNGITQIVRFINADGQTEELVSSQTREDMFEAQARAMIQACEGKLDGRLATLTDGIRAIAICDAARVASQSRREASIEYP
jgi:predicted dehydrogenase